MRRKGGGEGLGNVKGSGGASEEIMAGGPFSKEQCQSVSLWVKDLQIVS